MDWNNSESRLLAGELIRYLEDWDFAIEILNSVKDARFQFFCAKVNGKCDEKNNQVFQF